MQRTKAAEAYLEMCLREMGWWATMVPIYQKEEQAELSTSGAEWFAAAFVIALLLLFFLGMRRRTL